MSQPLQRRIQFIDTVLYDGTNAQQILDLINQDFGTMTIVERPDVGENVVQFCALEQDPNCLNCSPIEPGRHITITSTGNTVGAVFEPSYLVGNFLDFPNSWPDVDALSTRVDELTVTVSTLAQLVTGA